ncbi:MAG: MFS transporter [Deltaproteobacteria bacterium]|nr:MFS transporter [Deltaproteobacteria bacterium]
MSRWTWIVVFFSRLLLNLGVRVTYPFLPAIARGLSISFQQAGFLVAARHFVGLTGALWALVAEKKGYGWGMMIGLTALLLGTFTVSLSTGFAFALVGFILIGISKPVYDPSVQAFVSARIPYGKRAMALGILETSWAGSWLLGIPLSGVLIAHFGWHSPFGFISGAALIAIVLTARLRDITSTDQIAGYATEQSLSTPPETPLSKIGPLLILGVSLLMVSANENMVIVYGAWLEEQFHLQVRELGFFSILVGVAELGGELTVVALVDRIGKRKAILGGLVLTGLSYLALPFCQNSIYVALAGLVCMFYLFEFTIVSIFPYVSEMVPAQRGKWLAFNYTALVIGRLCGALSGPWLWQRSTNILFLVIMSLAVQTLAIVLLLSARPKTNAMDMRIKE